MNANNEKHLVIKCQNRHLHISPKGNQVEGNIIAFLGKNTIIIRCPDKHCRSWARLEFGFPGLEQLDFRKAGIVQTAIRPDTMKLNVSKAVCVIDTAPSPKEMSQELA